jgi:hypothetical protein
MREAGARCFTRYKRSGDWWLAIIYTWNRSNQAYDVRCEVGGRRVAVESGRLAVVASDDEPVSFEPPVEPPSGVFPAKPALPPLPLPRSIHRRQR